MRYHLRMRPTAKFLGGTAMLVAESLVQVLSHLQSLQYVKVNAPNLYGFLLSPAFTLAFLVLAVTFLISGFIEMRKRGTEAPPPVEGFRQEAYATDGPATNVGSIGNIHTGGGDVIIGSTPASGVPPSSTAKRPHFKFAGVGFPRHLQLSQSQKDGLVEATAPEERESSALGLTLRFRNAPAANSTRALNVVAQLRFYSKEWSKAADIDYGVWLDSPCDCTDMEVGDTRELCLFILVEGSRYALQDLRHGNREYEARPYVKDLPVDWFRYVNVTLIDQISHASATFLLQIWHDGTGWCHEVMQPGQNPRDLAPPPSPQPKDPKPEIKVSIEHATFHKGGFRTTSYRGGVYVTTEALLVVLTVKLFNSESTTTIDKCGLVVKTPTETLKGERFLKGARLEAGDPTHVELAIPKGLNEMEPNVRLERGVGVTRFVLFKVSGWPAEDLTKPAHLIFTATDAYGDEWKVEGDSA